MTNAVDVSEFRDVKPPVDEVSPLPKPGVSFFVIMIILALAVGAFIIYRLKRHPKIHPINSGVTRTAWDIAYERLKILQQKNLPERGKYKEFYVELSDIVRRYMEDRFEIRAPEMTTEEFLGRLQTSQRLETKLKNSLNQFLNACDLVKFAQYGPSPEEAKESFHLAEQLVEETKIEAAV